MIEPAVESGKRLTTGRLARTKAIRRVAGALRNAEAPVARDGGFRCAKRPRHPAGGRNGQAAGDGESVASGGRLL
ncbi:MAG: hypothetical protein WD066_10975 [Planctomycetaceae bacterium]